MAETPEQVLSAAAEIIERDGWHQGDFHQPPRYDTDNYLEADAQAELHAPVCALGAINRATTGNAADSGAIDSEVHALNYQARCMLAAVVDAGTPYIIPRWNDDPTRTAEDVLLALKRAANGG